jgi:hypothetical protein
MVRLGPPTALRAAWLPLAAAGDPAGCRAARRGAGKHVAQDRSGEPHRILADWLRPHQHVVLRAQNNPAVSPVTQGVRRNAQKGRDGAG